MKTTAVLAFILLFSNIGYTQKTEIDTTFGDHHIGLNFGSSTGLGFSYKYTKQRFGIQLTGLPVFNDGDFWASAGAALTWRSRKAIENDKNFVPLIYTGTSIMVDNSGLDFFSLAVGFGFEHKFSDRFVFSLMGRYGLYSTGSISTNIAAEMGLHYRL